MTKKNFIFIGIFIIIYNKGKIYEVLMLIQLLLYHFKREALENQSKIVEFLVASGKR